MCTSSVWSCRAWGCHRGDKWVSNMRQKLRARTKKRCQFLLYTTDCSSSWNFFSSAFSNLLVDWYSSCWNVSSCCVHHSTHMRRRKKNPQKDLTYMHVLVENDTWTRKQKANEKNNPCRSSQKMLSKQTPDPLKISIQGRCSNRGKAEATMSTILGERPAPAAEGEYM